MAHVGRSSDLKIDISIVSEKKREYKRVNGEALIGHKICRTQPSVNIAKYVDIGGGVSRKNIISNNTLESERRGINGRAAFLKKLLTRFADK